MAAEKRPAVMGRASQTDDMGLSHISFDSPYSYIQGPFAQHKRTAAGVSLRHLTTFHFRCSPIGFCRDAPPGRLFWWTKALASIRKKGYASISA